MPDALAKVKSALGPEAIILHTRTIKRGGLFGVGGRWLVEITATSDARVNAVREQARQAERGPVRPTGRQGPDRPAAALAPRGRTPAPANPCAVPAALDSTAMEELRQIRGMVGDLLRTRGAASAPDIPAELVDYYARLISQQVAGELAGDILRRIPAASGGGTASRNYGGRPGGSTASREEVEAALVRCIGEMMPKAEPIALARTQGPTIVAFVGPTGVGKTTTLAKIAANMKLGEGRSVGLVTIDTYRIAAVEQLRTYANILKMPLAAVSSVAELAQALDNMRDQELILIDTAGRSQRDEPRIGELAEFLAVAKPDQVHLVLSGTSQEAAIREAVEKFSGIGAGHVVFTKLDEAVGFGVILNVLRDLNLRLSYLTNGQSVPDDIVPGSAEQIARLVLGLPNPGAAPIVRESITGPLEIVA